MAITDDKGLFWNSQNGDRAYDAESFGKFLSRLVTAGVMPEDFEVTVGSGSMEVDVAAGFVNIENPLATNPCGKSRVFVSSTTLQIAQASSLNPRIDTIVIERNDSDREITMKVVTGTPAAIPVATAPVRTSTVYQLVLAEIFVPANSIVISQDNITMKRADSTVCGLITGTVSNNKIMYGTEDLTEGVSDLADGVVYFRYE